MLDPDCFEDYDEAQLPNKLKSRVQVEEYQQNFYPYKCIGVVLSHSKGRETCGTGFLVSSCLVLTAAHNFCRLDQNSIVKNTQCLFFPFDKSGINLKKPINVPKLDVCSKYIAILEEIIKLKQ